MNNLFKKGFASLALASAMTSSIFAGNAAYIDIKVNYLSGKGEAVIGADNNDTGKERVELLISILDKDGEYATKNRDGSDNVGAISIENRSTSSTLVSGQILDTALGESIISRALESRNNIRRFVIDYTIAIESRLENEITIVTGDGLNRISRKTVIKLGSVDAEGLIVRATPNGTFKTEKYINNNFADINVSGANGELNFQSSKAPGGLVGRDIPIQVYASTFDGNDSANGRFTFAPNLEGKTIVVQALADYSDNGVPSTVLNSVELVMKNGQATGNIKITNSMPAGLDDAVIAYTHRGLFESALTEGLGIAFLAYVKDEQSTNNYPTPITDTTDLSAYIFDANMSNWSDVTNDAAGAIDTTILSSTDTIQVKSGEPELLYVGTFDKTASKMSKLWKNTSIVFNVADGNETTADNFVQDINDSHEANKTLTVVDSFGNPAIVVDGTGVKVNYGSSTSSKFVKVLVSDVTTSAAAASTGAPYALSTINVEVSDSEDTNNTRGIKTVDFTVDGSNGMLAAVSTVKLTAKTLPLIEWKVDGGSGWKKAIYDINTTAAFTDAANFPLITAADALRVTENDFTVIIKAGIDDANLTDSNSTFRVFIKDNSGDEEYLESGDLKKYQIKVEGVRNASFGTAGLFPGKTVVNGGLGIDKAGDGYFQFDFNSSNTSMTAIPADFNITISKGITTELATIFVRNYNAADNEEEVVINIPTFEDKKISAFVEVYVDEKVDLTEAFPGTIVNFKFSGTAVTAGDMVTIDMNSTGLHGVNASNEGSFNGKLNTEGRIGVVGTDISSNTDGEITTALPENMIVQVVLYDTNKSNKAFYSFHNWDGNDVNDSAVMINGIRPVWLYLNEDGDTDDIKELKKTDRIVMAISDDNSIALVRTNLTTDGAGDGSEDEKRKTLPLDTLTVSAKAISTSKEVLTNVYYDIFTEQSDVKFVDMYGNDVDDLKGDISKDVEFTATSGIEFDNDGTDSWIKFTEAATGTEQTLTLSYTKDDGSKVSNTITWTKIKLSKTNSGFVITDDAGGFVDPNTGIFDVVNSEIIVKIIGNGNQKQSSTKITLTHTDATAKMRLVKIVDTTTDPYADVLSGLDSSIKTSIDKDGSYYIVSADKPGTMTMAVSSTVKDKKDNDVTISGTHSITFDAIDLNAPVVTGTDVTAVGGTVTVKVNDKNLNTVKTTVVINNIDGKLIKQATYSAGSYVASGLGDGLYQIVITPIDMAGNQPMKDGEAIDLKFVRTMGKGVATTAEILAANTLIAKGKYTVSGTFSSHDFDGVDASKDWIYTDKDGKVYQLLGETPNDTDVFGWKEVADIKSSGENMWYMVQTGTGKFDWALANKEGLAYQLSSVNDDGTFKFSGRLYLNAVVSDDGTITFTAK